MKKLFILTAALCLFLITIQTNLFAKPKDNLYGKLSRKPEVKVFLKEFSNNSDSKDVDVASLRKTLSDMLKERKSIHFKVVESESLADITIDCKIIKYLWLEDDPIDMIYGTGPLAYDVLVKQNYAYMEVNFSVIGSDSQKELWKDTLKVDITKSDMDAKASIPLINEKTAKAFIKRCFSKRYSKKSNSSPI